MRLSADEKLGLMKVFRVYRPNPPEHYRERGVANPPEEPQFEGVMFSDGTVAIRWLTEHRSVSFWSSLEELLAVHGHPEYDTVFESGEVRWP
jgi:hypothetical protein